MLLQFVSEVSGPSELPVAVPRPQKLKYKHNIDLKLS